MFKHSYQNSSGAAVSHSGNFNKITAGAQGSTRLISVGASSELSDGSDIEAAVTFSGFPRSNTRFADITVSQFKYPTIPLVKALK